MYKSIPYILTLAYVAINLFCLSKYLDHVISDAQFIFFFISSTFITWLCISLMEERQDV